MNTYIISFGQKEHLLRERRFRQVQQMGQDIAQSLTGDGYSAQFEGAYRRGKQVISGVVVESSTHLYLDDFARAIEGRTRAYTVTQIGGTPAANRRPVRSRAGGLEDRADEKPGISMESRMVNYAGNDPIPNPPYLTKEQLSGLIKNVRTALRSRPRKRIIKTGLSPEARAVRHR